MQQLGCESHSVTCVSCYVHVYGNKVIIIIIIIIIYLTIFNKFATQGTPQMTVDKDNISLSRVYTQVPTILSVTCTYFMCTPP